MLIDTATGRSKQIFSVPRQSVHGPELSPTARELYVHLTQTQSDIVLARLTMGAPARTSAP
jgi:hypothetical protein